MTSACRWEVEVICEQRAADHVISDTGFDRVNPIAVKMYHADIWPQSSFPARRRVDA